MFRFNLDTLKVSSVRGDIRGLSSERVNEVLKALKLAGIEDSTDDATGRYPEFKVYETAKMPVTSKVEEALATKVIDMTRIFQDN
jgi:hypothetical protein